jgi:hypothetical protein
MDDQSKKLAKVASMVEPPDALGRRQEAGHPAGVFDLTMSQREEPCRFMDNA